MKLIWGQIPLRGLHDANPSANVGVNGPASGRLLSMNLTINDAVPLSFIYPANQGQAHIAWKEAQKEHLPSFVTYLYPRKIRLKHSCD